MVCVIGDRCLVLFLLVDSPLFAVRSLCGILRTGALDTSTSHICAPVLWLVFRSSINRLTTGTVVARLPVARILGPNPNYTSFCTRLFLVPVHLSCETPLFAYAAFLHAYDASSTREPYDEVVHVWGGASRQGELTSRRWAGGFLNIG